MLAKKRKFLQCEGGRVTDSRLTALLRVPGGSVVLAANQALIEGSASLRATFDLSNESAASGEVSGKTFWKTVAHWADFENFILKHHPDTPDGIMIKSWEKRAPFDKDAEGNDIKPSFSQPIAQLILEQYLKSYSTPRGTFHAGTIPGRAFVHPDTGVMANPTPTWKPIVAAVSTFHNLFQLREPNISCPRIATMLAKEMRAYHPLKQAPC